MKKITNVNSGIDNTRDKLTIIKTKKQDISNTISSWRFFFAIYLVCHILKETFKDYKHTSRNKRRISKSFTKTCVSNVGKIRKMTTK